MSSHTRRWIRRALAATLSAIAMLASGGQARAASSMASAQATTLGGFTSQNWPVVFRTSRDGRTLALGRIVLWTRCTSGLSFATQDGFRGLRLGAGGRFAEHRTFPPTKQSNGWIFGGSDAFAGRLNRRHSRLSGAWTMHETVVSPSGQTDQCDSGAVGFHAAL